MFYADPADPNALYQGDIVADVPFFSIPGKPLVLRPDHGQPAFTPRDCSRVRIHMAALGRLADSFAAGGENFLLPAEPRLVQIVSQTCDIEHRSHVFVAPVLPRSKVQPDSLWEKIADYQVPRYFPLPPTAGVEDCAADLSKILAVRRDMLEIDRRAATLSEDARRLFQERLSFFLTRPFEG